MDKATPTSSKSLVSPPIKKRRVESATSPINGCTILITGLANSGKSTLSTKLTTFLKLHGIPVKQLDGKKLAKGLCSIELVGNADTFVHLSSEAAKLFTEDGFISIISIVAPFNEDRGKARQSHDDDGLRFCEVFLDRPKEECDTMSRNVLYPVDINYERPENADIHIETLEKSHDELLSELVAALALNDLIPNHLTLSLSSPSLPPTPSTNVASSFVDSDDDQDMDDDNEGGNVPFKLPKKGSALRAIFEFVKNEMKTRGYNDRDENMDKDDRFLQIMVEWKDWEMSHVGEDRFYPVNIPAPTRKTTPTKASPKSPKKYGIGKEKLVPVQWNGTTIKYDTNPRVNDYLKASKCESCWQNGNIRLCRSHSPTQFCFFGILRDANVTTIKILASVDYRASEKKEWKVAFGLKNVASKSLITYISTHPAANFQPVYEKRMSFGHALKLPIIHTATLSTALIVLFRNMCTDAQMQPHQLLQHEFLMQNSNLPVLLNTLNENGITFIVGDEYEEPPSASPMASTYCWKLPSVYLGVKPDHKINVGLKVAISGTDPHSATHEQRGETFTSGTLYQTPLTPEQIIIGNSTPAKRGAEWTPDQTALHKLVENDCKRKEGLGIATVVIASMLGESHNGHPIVSDNKKYEHGNIGAIQQGDIVYIENVFKLLTGRSLTITVTPSNDLTFNDELFH